VTLPFDLLARLQDETTQAAIAPGDSEARDRAGRTLAALRTAYAALPTAEREALTPLAQLLSQRVAALDSPQLTTASAPALVITAVPHAGHATLLADNDQPPLPRPDHDQHDRCDPAASRADEAARIRAEPPPDPDALLTLVGVDTYRPGQRDVVAAAVAGRDALVVMPTGGGKSLCYQLPALAGSAGLTIVVSPLIALMRDQHDRLASHAGEQVVMLSSAQTEDQQRRSLALIHRGQARLVFCAPERFTSHGFLRAIATRAVRLFVVDEAHCIIDGHDFRPDYLRLTQILPTLGNPPVMALTATATPVVADEITRRLGLRDPVIIRSGFDRPNITFDVLAFSGAGAVERKIQTLIAGLRETDATPAIVYCGTRKDTETVAARLAAEAFTSGVYHAGCRVSERQAVQDAFMAGAIDVVCATNAFGMGVDKADVRSVWHWAIPTSVESYYQEAGRAGRDGQPARAVLLAMRADLGRLIMFNRRRGVELEQVTRMLAGFARHQDRFEIDAFEDDTDRLALSILERVGAVAIEAMPGGRLRVQVLQRDLVGARRAAAVTMIGHARGLGWEAYRAIERFCTDTTTCRRRMLLDHFGDASTPHPTVRCCDVCAPPAVGAVTASVATGRRRHARTPGSTAPAATVEAPLDPQAAALYDDLVAWRRGRISGNRPAYTVCPNTTLRRIADSRPDSIEALTAIRGVGPGFVSTHAESLLELLENHPRW
jgi:ATP-dependent DNA helicase RecQ